MIQVLGMSLPYSSSTPATFPRMLISISPHNEKHADVLVHEKEKTQECFKAARYLKKLLELDIKPRFGHLFVRPTEFMTRCFRDIVTRQSFLNAIVIVTILGGSTNAVRRTSRLTSASLVNCLFLRSYIYLQWLAQQM